VRLKVIIAVLWLSCNTDGEPEMCWR